MTCGDDGAVLGFDTSGTYCAAAIVIGDRVAALRAEEMGRGQAERLFPMLARGPGRGGP
jgi:tRNA threonylcarbamoyladenosine biosynthesis protein TsaB